MGQTTALVVEDNRMIRGMVSLALSEEGYVVETAADGAEGLRAAGRACPSVVILDLGMPVLDGWGFASRFRARHGRHIPIVVMTAADDPNLFLQEIGAAGLLRKPFHLPELLGTVERALASAGSGAMPIPEGREGDILAVPAR
jgi:two-component system chemotaxis response regulator CheY